MTTESWEGSRRFEVTVAQRISSDSMISVSRKTEVGGAAKPGQVVKVFVGVRKERFAPARERGLKRLG